MHKCQSTFSSLDEPEIETQEDVTIEDDGHISGSIRLYRCCSDCGSDVKETVFDIYEDIDVPEEHKGHQLMIDVDDPEATSRSVNKDKHGKPIKNSRYIKTMYGFEITYTVSCKDCNVEIETSTIMDEVQASGFDELE